MSINVIEKMNQNRMMLKLIISISLMVFIWTLLPCLFSYNSAVIIVLFIGISLVLMQMDSSLSTSQQRKILMRYLSCGFLSLFLWLIGKRELHSFAQYSANSIIIWYPVAFAYYLIYKKPDKHVLKIFMCILLLIIICTGITTFIGLQIYPKASRLLAGGRHLPEMIAMLRSRNIGGYSYIYMICLIFPVLLGMSCISIPNGKIEKTLSIICVLIFPFIILYSQYMIALYMMLYSLAVLLVSFLLFMVIRRYNKAIKKRIVILCIIPVIAVMFVLFLTPINNGIRMVADITGLKYLDERAASMLEDDDFMYEGGNPLDFRIKAYSRVIKSFLYSPFFGSLTDTRVKLSHHSDIIDGLLGGGVLGAIIFILTLHYALSELIQGLKIPEKLQGNIILMGVLFIGLGVINTVFLSREIILMVIMCPTALSLGFAQ